MPKPGVGGQPNMQALMKQAQKMQAQLAEVQAQIASSQFEGTSGGGLVTVTVGGQGELLGLAIQPAALDPEDPETTADLVLAAYRDAAGKAHAYSDQAMAPMQGMLGGMGLPGL
ncbi:MAG: hypothetical protein JWM48_2425 [Mycobacterium sp.]|nr:hypothetical protein [Mycobacterium sp.]MCW2745875.1 hypothetical protein [Mycobacterium sp.]